jgi:hypothetical protein
MIYLASPYTHPDPLEMEYRYECILETTAHFLTQGHPVYSPIVHCHPLAKAKDLPRNYDFWFQYNIHMLELADEVWVIQLDGWQKSQGVNSEIAHAIGAGKPVLYFEYDGGISGQNNQHSGI